MNRIRRRLVLLGIAIMVSLITVVSTTYAFVVLNDEARISKVDFEIQNQDGLLLSLDGVNYYNDLSYEMISKAMIEAQGETYAGDSDRILDHFNFLGVSLKASDGKIALDADRHLSFVTNKLKDPEDNGIDDISSTYELVNANPYSYITFDIYCKVETNAMDKDELASGYELYFSERTKITGLAQNVTLVNSLVAGDKEYKSGDEILVDPANAMRIAIVNAETVTVFEPNEGLGSSAVEGRTGVNDKMTNAMYTYYNNTHPVSPFEYAAEENEQYNTIKGDLSQTVLGEFKYTHADVEDLNNNFNVIKLTVAIYMDGWDADYFMGINNTALSVSLGFIIKKKD